MSTYSDYNEKQESAHHKVGAALRRGELSRPDNCQICGSKPGMVDCIKRPAFGTHFKGAKACRRPMVVAHHHKGYDYPLSVWFVCHTCNQRLRGIHDDSMTVKQTREFLYSRNCSLSNRWKLTPNPKNTLNTVHLINAVMSYLDVINSLPPDEVGSFVAGIKRDHRYFQMMQGRRKWYNTLSSVPNLQGSY